MAIQRKTEKSLLRDDEWALVSTTHQPEIGSVSPEALREARSTLRNWRDRSQTLKRQTRRAARGKGDGATPASGSGEREGRRSQVFAHALRRLNTELERRQHFETRRKGLEP